jgi:Undecaprenyl-phosphate glucose phosphotransferase
MIKKYQNSAGVMTRIADAMIVGAVWLAAYPIRFRWFRFLPFEGLPEFERYLALLPLVLVLWMAGFQFFGVYRYDRGMRRSIEVYSLLRAHLATMVLFTSLTYFITQYRFSRVVMVIFGILVFFGCWIFRALSRKVLRELHRKGIYNTRLLAVGAGKEINFLLGQLRRYPELGIHLVKLVAPADTDTVPELIRELAPKIVLIGLPKQEAARQHALIQSLKDETIDIHIIPDYSEYFALGATVESFDGIPLIHLNESPLFGYTAFLKRGMDFTLSFVGLLLLSPLFFILSLLVKLTSRGPILYRQERMGLDGRTFSMLKFRSMKMDAEVQTGAVWAIENDDRRTLIGKFLRATSMDELPQLWNVFAGDMSLVGPRPERPVFVDKFRHEIPNYMLRHKVKTGITGWAQVNGWRGDTSLEKRIECDIYYIRNWSMWLDFKILLLTVFKGFVNKNAY